jgi:hypothetical protein
MEEKLMQSAHFDLTTKYILNYKDISKNLIYQLKELEQFKFNTFPIPEKIYINIWKYFMSRCFKTNILFEYLFPITSFNDLEYYFDLVIPYNMSVAIGIVFLFLNSPTSSKKYTNLEEFIVSLC